MIFSSVVVVVVDFDVVRYHLNVEEKEEDKKVWGGDLIVVGDALVDGGVFSIIFVSLVGESLVPPGVVFPQSSGVFFVVVAYLLCMCVCQMSRAKLDERVCVRVGELVRGNRHGKRKRERRSSKIKTLQCHNIHLTSTHILAMRRYQTYPR